MKRRNFLQALGAALITPALPAYSLSDAGVYGLTNQELILKKPLVLRDCDFFMSRCHIMAAPDFADDCLIDANGGRGVISECYLDATGLCEAINWVEHNADFRVIRTTARERDGTKTYFDDVARLSQKPAP
jgi:hypothetical protein